MKKVGQKQNWAIALRKGLQQQMQDIPVQPRIHHTEGIHQAMEVYQHMAVVVPFNFP